MPEGTKFQEMIGHEITIPETKEEDKEDIPHTHRKGESWYKPSQKKKMKE